MGESGPDLLADRLDLTSGGDDDKAVGMLRGEGEVALAHGFVKLRAFAFHAVGPAELAGHGVGALPSGGGVHIKEESDIGTAIAEGEFVDLADGIDAQLAADALVDDAGIVETIGQDPLAIGERGEDGLPDELGAAGGEEEEFGLRAHAAAFRRVFEEVPDDFAQRGATGFPGGEAANPASFQQGTDLPDLGGFPATFGSFETDKHTAAH